MAEVVFVTGNEGKARYFSELVGMDIEHHSADVDEIQSLNLAEIATYKARQAYQQLGRPVIVEDTSLIINSLGGLPGPFIKWFEKAIDLEGICRLVDWKSDRSAKAQNVHVYYDGQILKVFSGEFEGAISDTPKGDTGFGFNPIFIPDGSSETMAQMNEEDFIKVYLKIKPILQVRDFLQSIKQAQ